jgi:glycosyltransferase involved in cell wall biosynthesis
MPLGTTDDGFLLVAARLIAYRRIDIAVTAATRLGRDLIVVGDGPESARLKALAGPTVRFTGRLLRPQLLDLFSRCHAYVVPGIEDFGIAPIEAMAAGKPVVGLRAGGVSETVVDGVTGVLFGGPSTEGLVDALERLDALTFEPTRLRTIARRYDTAVFRDRFRSLLERRGIIGAG